MINRYMTAIIVPLMCILAWGAIFARSADHNIQANKDLFYLYLCGVEMSDSAIHDEQVHLEKQLVSVQASDHLIYRAKMREAYCDNYPFTSASMYAAGRLQIYLGITNPKEDFATFIVSSMRWGMALSGAVLGILCLICVFWAARDALLLATFGAVALAAVLYLTIPPPTLAWMLLKSPPIRIVNPQNILGLGLYTWLNPTAVFSAFSVFPRCLCAMIAFAAFTLRWSGRNALAYWALLIVCFVHQSEAPILLVVMICCDLAIRPSELAQPRYILPISLTVLVVAFREHMLATLGFSWLVIAIIALTIMGAGLLAFAIPAAKAVAAPKFNAFNRWRANFFGKFSVPLAETIVIFAIWFDVLVVCFLFHNDTFYRVIYLWSELPSRYVGLFQLTVIAGFTYPAWTALVRTRPRIAGEAIAIMSCLMLFIAVTQLHGPWLSSSALYNGARQLEPIIAKGYDGEAGSYSRVETPWYYMILRKAYLGSPGIDEYFVKKPDGKVISGN